MVRGCRRTCATSGSPTGSSAADGARRVGGWRLIPRGISAARRCVASSRLTDHASSAQPKTYRSLSVERSVREVWTMQVRPIMSLTVGAALAGGIAAVPVPTASAISATHIGDIALTAQDVVIDFVRHAEMISPYENMLTPSRIIPGLRSVTSARNRRTTSATNSSTSSARLPASSPGRVCGLPRPPRRSPAWRA